MTVSLAAYSHALDHIWFGTRSRMVLRSMSSRLGIDPFYCIYSRHNRVRWYLLANAAAIDVAAARKLALKVMIQVADGKDPQAERRAERHADTFEQLATPYAKHSEKKNKSLKQADKFVRPYLLPKLGQLALFNARMTPTWPRIN